MSESISRKLAELKDSNEKAYSKQTQNCENVYNEMKSMGLTGKQDFNGEVQPIGDSSSNVNLDNCSYSYFC